MSKKQAIISLVLLTVVGSFVNFYCTNLIMSDISNMFYGVHNADIISSIPGLIFAMDFVLLAIFFMRLYLYKDQKKYIIRHYLLLLFIFSCVGFIASILTGTMVYKSFVAPYPFPLYTIFGLIIHLGLAVLSIYYRIKLSKEIEEDNEKKKTTFGYVLYSILLCIIVYFAYDKFGALLWAPTYFFFRTFNLTFPFYLSLLTPLFILIIVVIMHLGLFDNNIKWYVILSGIVLFLSIVLSLLVAIVGYKYTDFISSISMALPLERLATKPFDIYFRGFYSISLSIYLLVVSIIKLKKSK